MVRIQVGLTDAEAAKLRRMADRQDASRSEIMRRLLAAAPEHAPLPDREELKRRALAAVGCADFGPADIARRHSYY